MRKVFIVCCFIVFAGSNAKALAMAVWDAGNWAENSVSAYESMQQSLKQIEQLKTHIQQVQLDIQNMMNPSQFKWSNFDSVLNSLKDSMNALDNLGGTAGNLDQYLGSMGTYESYGDGQLHESSNLMQSEGAAMKMQKDASDDVLRLVEQQRNDRNQLADDLNSIQTQTAGAEGMQQAVQGTNQLLSLLVKQSGEIHALLLAQNTLFAAQSEKQQNEETMQKVGQAIVTGQSQRAKTEAKEGGMSFSLENF